MYPNGTSPPEPLPLASPGRPGRAELILAVLAVAFAFFISLNHDMNDKRAFNSDFASFIQLGRHAVTRATLFPADYGIPHELYTMPTLFPAMFLGLLYLLAGNSWAVILVGHFLFFFGLLLAFLYLFKALEVHTAYSLMAFSLLFPCGPNIIYFSPLAFFAFMCLGLYVRLEKGVLGRFDRVFRWLMPLIAFSHGFATLRLVCTLYLPLTVAAFWSQSAVISNSRSPNPFKWVDWWNFKFDPLVWLAACLLGHAAFEVYCAHSGFRLRPNLSTGLELAVWGDIPLRLGQVVLTSLRTLDWYSISLDFSNGLFSARAIHIFLSLLAVAVLVRFFAGVYREREGIWKTAIRSAFLGFGLTAVFLTFSSRYGITPRYLYPCLLLFAILAAFTMEYANRRRINVWLLLYLFGGLTLLYGANIHWESFFKDIRHPFWRREAAELERHLKPYGLTHGYATWWHAYKNAIGVDERLNIADVEILGDVAGVRLAHRLFFTKYSNFSPVFAGKNVFVMLTNEEERMALQSSVTAALFAKAKKLQPFKDYQLYQFSDRNPFIAFGTVLTEPGASFRLTALYPGLRYSETPELEGESAWFRESGDRTIIYGPYEPMPPGVYDFEIRGHMARNEAGMKFDIADLGRVLMPETPLSTTSDITVIRDVIIPKGVNYLEFRLFKDDLKAEFRFDSITVTRK